MIEISFSWDLKQRLISSLIVSIVFFTPFENKFLRSQEYDVILALLREWKYNSLFFFWVKLKKGVRREEEEEGREDGGLVCMCV